MPTQEPGDISTLQTETIMEVNPEEFLDSSQSQTESAEESGTAASGKPVMSILTATIAAEVLARKFQKSKRWKEEYVSTLLPLLQLVEFDSAFADLNLSEISPGMKLGIGGVMILAAYLMTQDEEGDQ